MRHSGLDEAAEGIERRCGMTNIDFIRTNVDKRVLYEQLTEECCELGKAALKLIRTKDKSNPTTMRHADAVVDFLEEAIDVLIVLEALGWDTHSLADDAIDSPKWERWQKRITEGCAE